MEGEKQSVKVITKKSPQELAAQMGSVGYLGFRHRALPWGEELEEVYNQTRRDIEQSQKRGISDDALQNMLERLSREGQDKGTYAPSKGQKARELFEAVKHYYLQGDSNEQEAEINASIFLKNMGYLGGLRVWRGSYEKKISTDFNHFLDNHSLSKDEEKARTRVLSEKCIPIAEAEKTGMLSPFFPGGNFLYHGTKIEQAMQILESGELANFRAIWDREEERVKREGGERKPLPYNSGYEGISWNFNAIGALPGDRYHLVGFLTSPNDVLTPSLQLAIPSRPAPNELVLIDGNIDSREYYQLKPQKELLWNFGIGEMNSVRSNLIDLVSFKGEEAKGNTNPRSSMLHKFISSDLSDAEIAALLQEEYTLRNNGLVEFSPNLSVQTQELEDQIPAGAVWLQALIDTGRIQQVKEFEDVTSVRQAIGIINNENWLHLIAELKKDYGFVQEQISASVQEKKMPPISVSIADTYFVVPDVDLSKWLKVLARCKTSPRAILVYPHSKIRLENFATLHRGDNEALTGELKRAIPPSPSYIDYERELLGERITPEKMAGHRKHVIGEQFLEKRKSLRKNAEGNLVLT